MGSTTAGPLDGWSSGNVEFIRTVPGPATTPYHQWGMKALGKFLYVTGSSLSIFDVSEPEDPKLLSEVPIDPPLMFSEDPQTNGDILVAFLRGTIEGGASLAVYDVSDKSEPVLLARLPSQLQHTITCLQGCKWAYGSEGRIYDLRDPSDPKEVNAKWDTFLEFRQPANPTGVPDAHDVTEVAPGLVLTASVPMYLLDVRDPLAPTVLARSDASPYSFGGVEWPRGGKDRLILSFAEPGPLTVPTCSARDALRGTTFDTGFRSWDATKWKKSGLIPGIDDYFASDGTLQDGSPPAGLFALGHGCSAGWFDVHPRFHNGGVVALSHHNYGVKFLNVSSQGEVSEVGFWLPISSALVGPEDVAWITDEIVYSLTAGRGIDVLRFTGANP